MADDLLSIASRVETNPLGRLMHGHRELFHSNLLGWYFDVLPDAADATLKPFSVEGSGSDRKVEREAKNMDLVFHWEGRAPLIVENKVFSLPRKEQLVRYEAASVTWQQKPTYVLLSLGLPNFELGCWQHLSYQDLSARINDALPRSTSFEVEVMRRYSMLVADLHRLVAAVAVTSDDELVWPPFLATVESTQMRAALRKARAERVADAINRSMLTLSRPADSGMTRGKPYIESFEDHEVNGCPVRIGWQLQANDFRRTVIYYDESITGDSPESRTAREDLSRLHPELFTFPLPLTQVLAGRNEFNHFSPGSVLKYVQVPGITVADLKVAAAGVHADVRTLTAKKAP